MLVIRRKHGKLRKFAIMFKAGEFAPVTTQQEREQLFADFKRWGVSLASLADGLAVPYDRVRGWKSRPQYRIPDRYWYQLVHAHKAIYAHLMENGYIDIAGDILPKWKVKPRNKSNKPHNETTSETDK